MNKISELKGSKEGHRAFLVGNGPSLKAHQLGRLMNEDTFAMNDIAAIFPETLWRPTYYVGVATAFRRPKDRGQVLKGVTAARVAFMHKGFTLWGGQNCVYLNTFHEDLTFENVNVRMWQDDMGVGVCKWGTSMYATMQIAAYLGYKELNLIGVDGHYTGDRAKDYHSANYSGEAKIKTDPQAANRDHLIAHLMAQINCMRLGVQVYNCSEGGRLSVYDRRTLREALQ